MSKPNTPHDLEHRVKVLEEEMGAVAEALKEISRKLDKLDAIHASVEALRDDTKGAFERIEERTGGFDEQLKGLLRDTGFPVIEGRQAKPNGYCWCGCGETTTPGRFFIQAHDVKAWGYLNTRFKTSIPRGDVVPPVRSSNGIANLLCTLGFDPNTNPVKPRPSLGDGAQG